MNDPDPMSEPRDCGADAAAYALGALDRDEGEAYRRHVFACVVCRDEVATLQAIVDVLPMAAPQLRASRRLRRQTLARVEAEARRPETAHRWRWLRLLLSPSALTPSASLARRSSPAMAGLLAAAAVGVGAVELASTSSGSVHTVPTAVISEGRFASAVLHVSSGHAELIVSRMPVPPSGKIYQVWLKHPGKTPQPTSALFSVTSRGAAAVDVPGNLAGVSEVLVSPEPLGGSVVPTHAPVIVAALAS